MKKVMFICTANSCRSQMAEGFARTYGKGVLDVYSAGIMSAGVHRRAAEVMQELDIDISGQRSKEIDPVLLQEMDLVVTLCDYAERMCAHIPSEVKRIHIPVRDPVSSFGSEEAKLNDFRRARDEIRDIVLKLIRELNAG